MGREPTGPRFLFGEGGGVSSLGGEGGAAAHMGEPKSGEKSRYFHVSELENSPGPELSAHHARLEGSVGVDDVHESRGLLGDDVLSQLRDGVHVGTVHEPGSSRVQTLMEDW